LRTGPIDRVPRHEKPILPSDRPKIFWIAGDRYPDRVLETRDWRWWFTCSARRLFSCGKRSIGLRRARPVMMRRDGGATRRSSWP